jgi:hypothetical protein
LHEKQIVYTQFSSDLIPFASFVSAFFHALFSCCGMRKGKDPGVQLPTVRLPPLLPFVFLAVTVTDWFVFLQDGGGDVVVVKSTTAEGVIGKRRPKVVGGGENIPLDILKILSDWIAILEARGVSGAVLGNMYARLASLEDSLTSACVFF